MATPETLLVIPAVLVILFMFRNRRRRAAPSASYTYSNIAAVEAFLASAKSVSLGYSEINFFTKDGLEQGQQGYSSGQKGENIVSSRPGDWQPGWLVIATDNTGDPVFVDCSVDALPVYTAPHGEGAWKATRIANTLQKFDSIIQRLNQLSIGRENPVELQQNPLPPTAVKQFLGEIKEANPGVDMAFWEAIVEG